jgi:hypothetical protein
LSKRTWITPEDLLAIRYDLYDTSLTTYDIAYKHNCSQRTVVKVLFHKDLQELRELRKQVANTNRALYNANRWKHGCKVSVGADGYLYRRVPNWYDISSLAKRPRNIKPRQAVHVLIVCKYLGLTSLPKGYVVHHKNLKRNDNRISNLLLMSISDHRYYHTTGIYRKTGTYPACKRTAFGILPDSYQVE